MELQILRKKPTPADQKNVAKAAALQALVLLDLFTTEKETQFVEKEHVEMLLWRSSALSVLLLLCNLRCHYHFFHHCNFHCFHRRH